MLAVRNCCYVAVCSAARGTSAPTGEERGGAYRGGRPPTACSVLQNARIRFANNLHLLNNSVVSVSCRL